MLIRRFAGAGIPLSRKGQRKRRAVLADRSGSRDGTRNLHSVTIAALGSVSYLSSRAGTGAQPCSLGRVLINLAIVRQSLTAANDARVFLTPRCSSDLLSSSAGECTHALVKPSAAHINMICIQDAEKTRNDNRFHLVPFQDCFDSIRLAQRYAFRSSGKKKPRSRCGAAKSRRIHT